MPEFLPQLQPKVYTPKPALPFKEPPAKTPITFKTPKGTRPGQVTSPTPINPPLRVPAAPVGAVGAAAGSGGIGILLPALALAIPQILLLDSPAAAPELMPPEPPVAVELPVLPFQGGQERGVLYNVSLQWNMTGGQGQADIPNTGTLQLYGPIVGVYIYLASDGNCTYTIKSGLSPREGPVFPPQERYFVNSYHLRKPNIRITGITRVDNQPDTGGNPPPTNTPIYSSPGNSVATPKPQAPTAAPPPATGQPQGQPLPQLQQRTPTPAPTPTQTNQPLLQPQSIGQPQPLTFREFQPLPFADPAPLLGLNLVPPPAAEPTPAPVPTPTPNTNRSPAPFIPSAPFPPTILITPGGNPGPLIFTPNPSTGNPEPKAPPTTSPIRSPDPEPTDLDKFRDTVNKLLLPIGLGVTGITALLNPIPGKVDQIKNQTDPNTLKEISKSATCETFQPGGCAAGLPKNAEDAAKNSANNGAALSAISAFLQALQTVFLQPILAGVNLINTKLGPVMAGVDGIGGFLSRLSKSLGVDRALNLIAIASNLHNAMMLSASLKVTLLEMLSSVGNATGLLQTSENENVDLNAVFNQGIESFMVTILGTENYAGLKVNLRKYNAIYRAATNSLNATASMFNSIGDAIETAAEYTGKIGNALRAASVVRENAYNFMSERITVKTSKFMTFQSKVGDVTQVLETINEIAENVVEGQQQYTEAVKATAEFKKALADADRPEAIDNKLIKAEAEKIKANLVKDPTGEDETGLLSFLTDL